MATDIKGPHAVQREFSVYSFDDFLSNSRYAVVKHIKTSQKLSVNLFPYN
jgi:hypothetical protein